MNDKRRIVMELISAEWINGTTAEEVVETAIRLADLIIKATPDVVTYGGGEHQFTEPTRANPEKVARKKRFFF